MTNNKIQAGYKKDVLREHCLLIKQKKILNRLYFDFYKRMKKVVVPSGRKVEIGSGGGFIKEEMPEMVTTDVIKGPMIDYVFFAEKMPFKDNTVAAFYLLNTLHHIKDVKMAFTEMDRCLKRGGKVIMIEPANTWWSKVIYLFHRETFDIHKDWKIKGRDRLSDSNIALPWIVFFRDRKKFSRLFPRLKVANIECHTPFLYILSGGLTWPQMLPTFAYPILSKIEEWFEKWQWSWGMFMTIELEKI